MKGNLRWQRCIHRTPCRIYREIDTRTRQRAPYTRLPAPSRAWPTSPHVASGDARTALVCECAPIIWNSAITPPTYTAAASECVRREVIIIISRLIIVIRGDGTRCHRQINAARPDDARPARSTLPLLRLLLFCVVEKPSLCCVVLCCVPGPIALDCLDATGRFYQVC